MYGCEAWSLSLKEEHKRVRKTKALLKEGKKQLGTYSCRQNNIKIDPRDGGCEVVD
jgi:hypothetical protein